MLFLTLEFLDVLLTTVATAVASLPLSLVLSIMLDHTLGIPDNLDNATSEERSLSGLTSYTAIAVFCFTTAVCVGLKSIFGGLMIWVAVAAVMTVFLWWFAVKKIYPKLSFLDFTPRFNRAMEGEFVQVKK